ncbi:MAG: ribonuclease III [Gammaproteobacteria bacterium RIFCSPHIGHO2_12_FULL_35_23]|nr:MAG: ribonuclease III [Gammaproteobacteria bacterium RIFCSPHIGHO2_12_FULL_35_23]
MSKSLEKTIGYSFQQQELLKRALAHRSYGKQNNERLEFLGDSLLNFIVAEDLFKRFPDAVEGELSRLRATIVKGETLAKIALKLKLGSHLLLGSGELKSGGERRNSILADALEAIIAAIYLDAGLEICRERVLEWFVQELANISPDRIIKDPKSTLQEYLQSKQLPLPEYYLVATSGKEHEQIFTVECRVALLNHPVAGIETSRRRAEQQAASNALMELKIYG